MACDRRSTSLTRLARRVAIAGSVAAFGVVLGGCGTGPGPVGEPDSGITGQTMVDGGCPVVRDGTPCPDRPIAAKVTVTRSVGGKTVATFNTGEDGTFRVPLEAGSYVLHAANEGNTILPAVGEIPVTVIAGRFQTVTINFDTGIR